MTDARHFRFELRYEVTATIEARDLWPDGDVPADPTAADVEALISKDGGWHRVLIDWNLGLDADTSIMRYPREEPSHD
jgi:hypothetical protein